VVQRLLIDAPSVDTGAGKGGDDIAITEENAEEVLKHVNKFAR
jgi:hypothetical protein